MLYRGFFHAPSYAGGIFPQKKTQTGQLRVLMVRLKRYISIHNGDIRGYQKYIASRDIEPK